MPTRLLYLCNAPAVMAGVEKTVLMLLDRLDRDRFSPRIILNGEGPFADCLRQHDADLEIIPAAGRLDRTWSRRLADSLAQRPADVVQLHLSRLNARLLHRHGARVVERLNMTRHAGLYPMRFKAIDCWTQRWIDHFIVVSHSLRQSFIDRGYPPDKLTTVHNGIQPPDAPVQPILRHELQLPDDAILIGTAARLTPQKGLETFLAAAAALKARYPRLHIILAGDGEHRQPLQALAGQLGIADCVHFLGYRQDILPVLASLDIFLYLSRWEPFANTLLEAMALGLPIVTTNVGGNAEAMTDGKTGLLVPVDDVPATTAAVTTLLDDPQRAADLGQAARQAVDTYSIDAMVKGHQDVYTHLTESRP